MRVGILGSGLIYDHFQLEQACTAGTRSGRVTAARGVRALGAEL